MALNGRLPQSDLTSENEASKSRFEQDPQLGACSGTSSQLSGCLPFIKMFPKFQLEC